MDISIASGVAFVKQRNLRVGCCILGVSGVYYPQVISVVDIYREYLLQLSSVRTSEICGPATSCPCPNGSTHAVGTDTCPRKARETCRLPGTRLDRPQQAHAGMPKLLVMLSVLTHRYSVSMGSF